MTEDQQQQQQQQQSQSPKERKSIHEMRNQDFVSRLLAATPPYLYSTPVGTNNFFFSDMLRSLVQAKNNETARNLQLQQQQAAISRRPRKRSWSQHRPYYDHVRERKEVEVEKPLELTNKQLYPIAAKYNKTEAPTKPAEVKTSDAPPTQVAEQQPPQTAPASELALPPPPPVWYPPLYPPYGIDPLHFFIDLRVSGHIYDRKKENVSPLGANSENNNIPASSESEAIGKHRHGSAFTVPTKTASAINLSSSSGADKIENYAKYYDLGEAKENQPNLKSTPNYVLQNLPRLYNQFAAKDESFFDGDNKSEPDGDDNENCQIGKEGHIDVEMIDTLRYRNELSRDGSRGPSDDGTVHEID